MLAIFLHSKKKKANCSAVCCKLLEDIAGGASSAAGRVKWRRSVCLKTLVGCSPDEDDYDDYHDDDDGDYIAEEMIAADDSITNEHLDGKLQANARGPRPQPTWSQGVGERVALIKRQVCENFVFGFN